MSIVEILLLGVGLAMDAFTVSICKGLKMRKIIVWQMFLISFFFGLFQFAMPVVGYYLGVQFEEYISSYAHWIAFVLLAFIGVKMIVETISEKEEKDTKQKSFEATQVIKENQNENMEENQQVKKEKFDFKELLVLSVATSIDALAVGISFAFLKENVWIPSLVIGLVTFVFCLIGVFVGNFFGSKFKKTAEIVGGVILILIGLKILLENLGVIVF